MRVGRARVGSGAVWPACVKPGADLRRCGDDFAVLVVQNREDGPILHEVVSPSLFESGTLIQVMGTGKVEYSGKRVSRILLYPGEEVVIWFYAEKGRTYSFQCNINGHSMQGTVRTS